MATKSAPSIGNRIAPLRFIVFLLLFALIGAAIQWKTGLWHYAVMGGFDVAAAIFLISLWPLIADGSATSIRKHASQNDANRTMLLILSAVIAIVLLITIRAELAGPGEPLASLIIATLGIAWLFANTLYALHYAHLFYGDGRGKTGLQFPEETTPDYWDFVYFAFTLGMTFQTSDVGITSRTIRRVVLAQCIAAFVFNIGILAFTINTLGG